MPPPPSPDARRANRLAAETSAYLRQHMHNPVDWYAWGPEAFEAAAQSDRPLLVSIGYSSCHWCHVMERESFEDEATAALMNEHFVSVKVDREERPDVDQIYMETVLRLNGHGGWPLTVFCAPDGRPFYAGTYFPAPGSPNHRGGASFHDILRAVSEAYRDKRDEVERTCGQILEALAERSTGAHAGFPGAKELVDAASQIMSSADRQRGGFGEGAKFPTPTNLELLVAACDYTEQEHAREIFQHCVQTAQVMARRGLYDHLGGGFHRYCVDPAWTIPHFEKMLYDQGLLLRAYAELWRRSGQPEELAWPIRETAAYLLREMCGEEGPAGGFYASQDADSEGEEGRFFVWRPEEIREALGDEADAFAATYGVSEAGNFEGRRSHLVDVAGRPRGELAEARAKLLAVRRRRVAPATDTKRIAAWNGYVISGLARAGSLLGDEDLVAAAAAAGDFARDTLRDASGRLQRIFDGERAKVPAFLDDHAALLDAYLDCFRAGAGERFLAAACELGDAILDRFFDAEEDDLFFTPRDGEALVHRPRSDHDGATPHAAGLAVLGLARLSELTGRHELGNAADRVLDTHAAALARTPHAYPTLLRAAALVERGIGVAVVVAESPEDPAARALAARARRELMPEDAVVTLSPGHPPAGLAAHWSAGRELVDGHAAVYLCRGRSCSLPITDPAELSLTRVPAPQVRSAR